MPTLSWDAVEPAGTADTPDRPGMYAWIREGQVVFIGAARSLRNRIAHGELRLSSGRQLSPLRERVALHLIRDVHAAIPWRGDDRRQAVDAWLGECSIAWKALPLAEAKRQVEYVLAAEVPLLHQWRPRPGEDEWLARHLERVSAGGVVYTEVPIVGGPGSSLRRIEPCVCAATSRSPSATSNPGGSNANADLQLLRSSRSRSR